MWGSVHKQFWQLTKDGSHLDEAVRAYEQGFISATITMTSTLPSC
jgi:hypothetical protein